MPWRAMRSRLAGFLLLGLLGFAPNVMAAVPLPTAKPSKIAASVPVPHNKPLSSTLREPSLPALGSVPRADPLPVIPQSDAIPQPGSRRLKLVNLHTGESADVVFWQNGRYVPAGLKKLNHLLIDHRSGKTTNVDPKLFMLIHRLYTDLKATSTIQIISGYRASESNAAMRKQGRHVARKSQHILGKAMDMRIPGIPLTKLRDKALSYGEGGVGFYPGDNFVHIDTGPPRRWNG